MHHDFVGLQTLGLDMDNHLALVGKLDCVADQVQHDLPQAVDIPYQDVRHVRQDMAG